jgi:hypothetical protein
VQRVVTEWTRASRGAPGATRRARVPLAFPLPPGDPGAVPRCGVLVHGVRAAEEDGFVVHHTREEYPPPGADPLTLDRAAGVRLRRSGDDLVVTGRPDVWAPSLVAHPPRAGRDLLRLAPGRWGRWMVNFRVVDEHLSAWSYRLWVVNVAHLPGRADPAVFVHGGPAAVVDNRARLR